MNFNDYCLGHPLEVGTEPVLLIDRATIEDRWGVRRVLNEPIKDPRNPLLMSDMPWEGNISASSVLYDEHDRLWRMWYTANDWHAMAHAFVLNDWKPEHGCTYFMCYAESDDGVNWRRPKLEGKSYRRHQRTNVVHLGKKKCAAARVMWNHPGTGQPGRFMLTYKDDLPQGKGALCLAYSDDGIEWRDDPRNPAFIGLRDTWHNMVHDPRRNRWLLITRPTTFAGATDVPGGPTEHNYKRRMAVMVGDTPFDFKPPRVVLWPEENDDPDFDNFMVDRVGDQFICMLSSMTAPPNMEFNLHLAFSGDGLDWRMLPERQQYIPHGGPESFDCGSVSSAGGFVTVGDTSYIYYTGSRRGQAQSNRNNARGIGRVQFGRDRYVAQMGTHTGGFLLTREMIVAAPQLVINTTVATGYETDPAFAAIPPELAVEVLAIKPGRAAAQPVAGYTLADCTTKAVDLFDHVVTWRDKPDLTELVGKPVFLRFYLKNVGIYTLRFR